MFVVVLVVRGDEWKTTFRIATSVTHTRAPQGLRVLQPRRTSLHAEGFCIEAGHIAGMGRGVSFWIKKRASLRFVVFNYPPQKI